MNKAKLLDLAASLGFSLVDDGRGCEANTYNIDEHDMLALLAVMERVSAPPPPPALQQSMRVTALTHHEQAALVMLGLKSTLLQQHDAQRMVLQQGEKQATLYLTHPELFVRVVHGELMMLRSGDTHRIETVDYDRLQALGAKLYEYRKRYFYERHVDSNNTRAAEQFIDWVRCSNKPTYAVGTSWEAFVSAVRSCAYNSGLRREYGVRSVTLSKIPGTSKLHIEG